MTETTAAKPRSTVHIRVNYADVDRMGLLHHSVYLKYLERSREEYIRRRNGAYAALEDAGVLIVVVEANLKYKRPARFDDVLAVTLELYEVGAASMRIAYEVRRLGEDDPIATATTRHALMTREGRVLRLTDEIRAMLIRDEAVKRDGELD
jgi:acyl-CoA thioester hydrolase